MGSSVGVSQLFFSCRCCVCSAWLPCKPLLSPHFFFWLGRRLPRPPCLPPRAFPPRSFLSSSGPEHPVPCRHFHRLHRSSPLSPIHLSPLCTPAFFPVPRVLRMATPVVSVCDRVTLHGLCCILARPPSVTARRGCHNTQRWPRQHSNAAPAAQQSCGPPVTGHELV